MSFLYLCYSKFWYKMLVYDVMIKIKLNHDNFDRAAICLVRYEWKYNSLYVQHSFRNYLRLSSSSFHDFPLETTVGLEETPAIFNQSPAPTRLVFQSQFDIPREQTASPFYATPSYSFNSNECEYDIKNNSRNTLYRPVLLPTPRYFTPRCISSNIVYDSVRDGGDSFGFPTRYIGTEIGTVLHWTVNFLEIHAPIWSSSPFSASRWVILKISHSWKSIKSNTVSVELDN